MLAAEPWRYIEPGECELVPIFCDVDKRPMGFAALFLARMWARREMFCSNACAVLAEWHAPERR